MSTWTKRTVCIAGEELRFSEALKRFGNEAVDYLLAYRRIFKLGWEPERAFREPPRSYKKK